ncbi:ribokinase [Companilactobacillus alimentarius]|uniref:Ribokinase n=1 Tax=Companilactobacillus alimentarius DSM 20249 TaxID=1423720 RepID=A0A2K9HF14_9LACO|nr:ribokinase [Companilactobacillus alimentarius]AUI71150.1 ribokinase [Companilactobacillus alimentarius DSM 20249]KRK75279.1 ribokinase [Companilactobacillus alimentarius DSM 20249]MDT6951583.1 ribokinase [Companilactobacillus alimentarius]GEO43942.1 ribokinase [Companilactobacillus alimentarius]
MTNKVVVIGSINVDSIEHIDKLPKPGETIKMNAFSKAGGGKGANQAVAAVRSGAETSFIGRVSDDDNGKMMLELMQKDKIDVKNIIVTPNEDTGQSYILLQKSGQNSIIYQAGANSLVTAEDIDKASDVIKASDFVVTEFETPIVAAIEAFKIAHKANKKTILNPAPAVKDIPEELLKLTDVITPNETESELISGIKITDKESLEKSAKFYHNLGISCVIITLGSKGSFVSCKDIEEQISAFKVKAVDTTAAGDTFIGALVAELKSDLSNLHDAIVYASKASSLTVQKLGAQPSIPKREQVIK